MSVRSGRVGPLREWIEPLAAEGPRSERRSRSGDDPLAPAGPRPPAGRSAGRGDRYSPPSKRPRRRSGPSAGGRALLSTRRVLMSTASPALGVEHCWRGAGQRRRRGPRRAARGRGCRGWRSAPRLVVGVDRAGACRGPRPRRHAPRRAPGEHLAAHDRGEPAAASSSEGTAGDGRADEREPHPVSRWTRSDKLEPLAQAFCGHRRGRTARPAGQRAAGGRACRSSASAGRGRLSALPDPPAPGKLTRHPHVAGLPA